MIQSETHDLLDSCDLPEFIGSSNNLLGILMDPDTGLAEMIEVLNPHAVIVAKTLSLSNSAWSNPVSPITDFAVACGRLGCNVTKTLAIALAVGHRFVGTRCPEFDPRRYWESALIAAEVGASLAPEFSQEAGTARTAALLYNIGLLWLATECPEQLSEALGTRSENDSESLNERLLAACGFGYREAGLLLMTRLAMPTILTVSMEISVSPRAEAAHHSMFELVRLSAKLSALATQDVEQSVVLPNCASVGEERMQTVLESVRSQLPKIQSMTALVTSV